MTQVSDLHHATNLVAASLKAVGVNLEAIRLEISQQSIAPSNNENAGASGRHAGTAEQPQF